MKNVKILALFSVLFLVSTVAAFNVDTVSSSSIGTDSFQANGNLTDLGGSSEVNVSFKYRKSTASDWQKTSNITRNSTGLFNQSIEDLDSNTTYEFKAVGQNTTQTYIGNPLERNTTMLKTVPGEPVSFTTKEFAVETLSITNDSYVGTDWLRFRGNISGIDQELEDPIDVNFSYREEGDQTWSSVVAGKKTSNGTFTERVDGLNSSTTYEYRAEAVNRDGTVLKANTTMLKTLEGGAVTFSTPLKGSGTSDDPFKIATCTQLQKMQDNLTAHYELTGDVDCSGTETWNSGKGFNPVGNSTSGFEFQGTLDGNDYTIENLTINRDETYVGLLGYAGSGSKISNVSLNSVNISNDRSYVGGLVGRGEADISSTYVSGKISGYSRVGGLVGESRGEISDSYTDVDVRGDKDYGDNIGGLVGRNDYGSITGSYSIGNISGESMVGVLVGNNNADVSRSFALGNVSGDGVIGGLVGRHSHGTISTTYSAVNVSSEYYGGLAGTSYDTISNSYWDMDVSGGNTSAGGTGLTTSEMKKKSSFEDWDFQETWSMVEGETYPKLEFPAAGSGTEEDPYMVTNVRDLQAMEDNLTAHYELANDINASPTKDWNNGKGFRPIANSNSVEFQGYFDGNNHVVENLTINRGYGDDYTGLFGNTGSSSIIGNISLESVNISGGNKVGGLIGSNNGKVYSSYSEGVVSGYDEVGGLIGFTYRESRIYTSYSKGKVSGSNYVGGLIGEIFKGEVFNSYSHSNVSGISEIGGLIGYNFEGSVSSSYWGVNTSGQNTSAGGTPLTTSEMMNRSNFNNWDFNTTWGIDDQRTYPFHLGGGDGTESNPFEISTCNQLQYMENNLTAHYELVDDVDCSETENWNGNAGFDPVGNGSYIDGSFIGFEGGLDGNSHSVERLTISRDNSHVGLFGYTKASAEIGNVSVVDTDVQGNARIGALAGTNGGRIEYAYSTGIVSGSDDVGGLVGRNDAYREDGVISNSFSRASATSETGQYDRAGGLAGYNNEGVISSSYSLGRVSGGDTGGLIGYDNQGNVNGYWDINTSGQTSSDGGTGLTALQMRNKSELSGFKFTNTWEFVEGVNDNYPVLQRFEHTAQAPELDNVTIREQNRGTDKDVFIAGQPVRFTDGFSGATNWNWSWGDGTHDFYDNQGGEYVSHSYGSAGNYTVNLTVNNSEGSDWETREVEVIDPYSGGSGTSNDPFQISTCTELQKMSKSLDSSFELTQDIDCSETENWNGNDGFDPVGGEINSFGGRLNGKYYSIKNLSIDRTDEQYIGLIGYATTGSAISNISIINTHISGERDVGVLIGWNDGGNISNSYVSGSISASSSSWNAGGLTGVHTGHISRSYSNADVSGDNNVGGLVGYVSGGRISSSYSTGRLSGNDDVGGLVGIGGSDISNSYWDMNMSGQNTSAGEDPSNNYTGLTVFEMTGKSAKDNMNFDFQNTWWVNESRYPGLNELGPKPDFSLGDPNVTAPVSGETLEKDSVTLKAEVDHSDGFDVNVSFYNESGPRTLIQKKKISTPGNASINWSVPRGKHRFSVEVTDGFKTKTTETRCFTTTEENHEVLGCKQDWDNGTVNNLEVVDRKLGLNVTGVGPEMIWNYTGFSSRLQALASSEDHIYIASDSAIVQKLDKSTGNNIWNYTAHSDAIYDIAVDSSGNVYSASADNELHKIDSEGNQVWSYTGHSDVLTGVAVDSSGYVYSGSVDNELHKIDSEGNQVWSYTGHSDNVVGIVTDSGYIYSSSLGNELHKIDSEGNQVWSYTGHSDSVLDVDMGSESNVYSGSSDNTAHKIDISTGNRIWSYTNHSGSVNVAVGPKDNLYTASRDGEVHKVDSTGDRVWKYIGHSGSVSSIEADETGYIYSGQGDSLANHEVHKLKQSDKHASKGNLSYRFNNSEEKRWDVLEIDTDLNGQSVNATFETSEDSQEFELENGSNVLYLDQIGSSKQADLTLDFNTSDSAETPLVDSVELLSDVVNVFEEGSVFEASGSEYLDADKNNWDVNLTSNVSVSFDREVDSVWADVESPEGNSKRFFLDNTTWKNQSQVWFSEVDVASEFGEKGRYNVTFTANTSDGVESNYPETGFYVQNVTLTQELSQEKINPGESFDVSGDVELEGGELDVESPTYDPSATNISTCQELQDVNNDLDEDYELVNDIDCSMTEDWNNGSGFDPIGDKYTGFTGSFDGNRYGIRGLTINRSNTESVGLFASIDNPANITDVTLKSANVSGYTNTGSLIGRTNGGKVSSVHIKATEVSGYNDVGGLTGDNQGKVSESYSEAEVSASDWYVGGLIGNNQGKVSKSYSGGTVSGVDYVGGLIGESEEDISSSYSSANVSGENIVGGLVGENDQSNISYSYSTGNVSGNSDVGGLVGRDWNANVFRSYWDTESSGQSSSGGGTGLTTSQMTGKAAKTNMNGFDFNSNWTTVEGGYPQLQALRSYEVEVYRDTGSGYELIDSQKPVNENYSIQVSSGDTSPGTHDLKVVYEDENGIVGVNRTSFTVLNITTDIESVLDEGGSETLTVFRDSDTDYDLEFDDNATADSENPLTLQSVGSVYSIPGGWTFRSKDETKSDLAPGEWKQNDPKVDIGENAELGPQNVTITSSSSNGISDSDTVEVEVWTESSTSFVKPPEVINRNNDYYPLYAKVRDVANGSVLENVSTRFSVGESVETVETNSSGVAVFNWSVKDYNTGTHAVTVLTEDEPERYINSSDEYDSAQIDILGVMELDSYTQGKEPVYRKDSFENSSTTITSTIVDSQGALLDNVNVSFNISGVYRDCPTSSGSCSVSYNPDDSMSPGIYKVRVNATKPEFDPLRFNKSIEIRGALNIDQDSTRSIYTRGLTYQLDSTVTDENSNEVNGDVAWSLNGSEIVTGEDVSWTPDASVSRGFKTLNASTARNYFDDDSDARSIQIYGIAELESLYPSSSTIVPGAAINVTAEVVDANTSADVEGMPVVFKVNGTEKATVNTNSTGQASFEWRPTEETYNLTAHISDNEGIRYNVSKDMLRSTVEIDKETVIDRFSQSNSEVFRNNIKDRDSTTFEVNLSESSETDSKVPADNVTVSFEVNDTETETCKTDDNGYCSVDYNPSSEVSVGNVTVEVTTNRTGWESVEHNSSLIVKGLLSVSIQKPSESIVHRGSSVDLEVSALSGGSSVDVPVNWSYRGTQIGQGKYTTWDVPATKSTGSGTLKIEAGGNYYEADTDSVTRYIYGTSNVEFREPENSSEIGYGETPTVRCKVSDNNGVSIKNYPVEFTQNGSSFNSVQTDSNGEAAATWDVPNSIDTYEVGCRIGDNATLSYNASTEFESRLFRTKDDVAPELENLTVTPETVDPGDSATVEFYARDEVDVDTAWIVVENPNGIETEKLSAEAVDSDTYRLEFDTSRDDPEGTYTVKARANDTSGNLQTKLSTFAVDPNGQVEVSKGVDSFDSITQNSGETLTLRTNLSVEETANNANITAEVTDSSKISVNETRYNCGDLSNGSFCVRDFEVTVSAGAAPDTEYVTFDGEWANGNDNTTVSDFTELVIQKNPVLTVETGDQSSGVQHGGQDTVGFTVNSTGNYRVENYEASWSSGNLSEKLLEFGGDTETKLEPGETRQTDLTVSMPSGREPGIYLADLEFGSDNADNRMRELSVNVPVDASYQVPSTVDTSAVVGSTGVLAEVEVENTGNVNYTLEPTFSGDAADFIDAEPVDTTRQSSRSLTIDVVSGFQSAIKYNAQMNLSAGNPEYPEKTVDLDINVLDFAVGLKTSRTGIETEPENYSTVSYNVSLGGSERTENLTHTIKVNGTEAEVNGITETNGVFTANFTIPEVPDARNHDLDVQVYDQNNDVETEGTVEDRFWVPDVTDPVVSEFETAEVEPGENVTVNVSASDNSLKGSLDGVENVSINWTKPSGNGSTVYPVVEDGEWRSNFTNLSEGNHRLLVNATDPSGNYRTETDYIKVAPEFDMKGRFETASGETQKASVEFVDTVTKKRKNASLDGDYSLSIHEGTYDVGLNFSDQSIEMEEVEVTSNTTEVKAEELDRVSAVSPEAEARMMGVGVETDFEPSSSSITFDYSGHTDSIPSGEELEDLKLAHCADYSYSNRECNGGFETFNITDENIDRVEQTITVNVSGFSAYTLFFPAEEETQEQPQQEPESSGGGGGGGGISEDELKEGLEELEKSLSENESKSVSFGSNSITARIRPGETQRTSLSIENSMNTSQEFEFEAGEIVSEYVEAPSPVTLEPGESREVEVVVTASASEVPNSYSGYLHVDSEEVSADIPTNVNILPPNDELLDLSLTPVFESVQPGDEVKVETTLNNQGYARNVDVKVDVELVDPDTNETIATKQNTYAVGTTLTRVINLKVPEGVERKQYEVVGTARYTNIEVPRVANAITTVQVSTPFWQRTFIGVTFSTLGVGLLVALIVSLTGYGVYQYKRKKELEKKRYMEKIDLDTIPSGGRRQAYMGQLAEMGTRTFVDLDDLKTHALIAGATGSGKTVTGQAMVEEALKEGTNIIVLDPTAQWSGFLRECEDSVMKQLYSEYGMSLDDARSFDGNIRAVEPGEEVDISPYLEKDEDGEIIVFSMHKLDNENMDEFVDSTIQQVFDQNLPERDELETIIVYDEAHRLLEKFGGSGRGLDQLERGAREFRKWGVGMVMLSQVISDFPGEVRANIGTTVQMRTQYDEDLERLKNKFGMDTVKSVAKAEVGSGMLQNSDYNHGRPYFVDFRPLLHSPHRLSDEELDKYEDYNQRIDALEQKIDEMDEDEAYDYRSELKLAKRNLMKGSFNLVEIYIEELEEDLGK